MELKEYSEEKLRNKIKLIGWILAVLGIGILYIATNMLIERPSGNADLIALTAVIAGSSSAFLYRKKLIRELRSRES